MPLFIQIGRSYLNFIATDANPKFFSCCGVSGTPMVSYYYQHNQKQIRDNRLFTVKNEANNNDSQEFVEEKKEEDINNIPTNEVEKKNNDNDNTQEINDELKKEEKFMRKLNL